MQALVSASTNTSTAALVSINIKTPICTAGQRQRLQASLRTKTCQMAQHRGSSVAKPWPKSNLRKHAHNLLLDGPSRPTRPPPPGVPGGTKSSILRNTARLAARLHMYKCCTFDEDIAASRRTQPCAQHNRALHEPSHDHLRNARAPSVR